MNTVHCFRGLTVVAIGAAAALSSVVGATTASATTASAAAPAAARSTTQTATVLGEGAPEAIKDSYIVVLRESAVTAGGVTASGAASGLASAATALTRRYGGSVDHQYSSALRGFSAKLTKSAARRLAADPSVKYVEQDRMVRLAATQSNPTWGVDRIDQRALPLSNSYGYPGTTAKVTAYIVDTGIRTTHGDFGGRARNGWDFIDNDAVANDCHGHGTHVAGTVGGTKYGVAKEVKLVGVRVLSCSGSGSYSQIVSGVDWVTKNAVKPAVANMSLGGGTSTALDDAVRRSIASGVSYAVAAGNNNTDACKSSPARTAEAITVGASDSYDKRASFSNYGNCLDLFAPGVRIVSSANTGDTATTTMSGTSMASPHVAGAAAIYLAANPYASPAQVRNALVNGATTGKVTSVGTGSPNRLLYTRVAGSMTNGG